MFLKNIELINVRCFKHVKINFDLEGGDNRKWTVLLGENGTGKSTILRSIALVLAGSDALTDLIGEPDNWVRVGEKEATINAEIETKAGKNRQISLSIQRNSRRSAIISKSQESLSALNDALEHTDRSYFLIAYGASRRYGEASLSNSNKNYSSHPRTQSVATLFDSRQELNPIESWAMSLDYRSSSGINTITTVLDDFLPELTFVRIDKHKEALIFETPDGEIPLNQLSDGYQNISAWVGDLLYRVTEVFDDYKNPLDVRGLLIIDEIDLHLHPKWQRNLINFLNEKLPNMQLIVTTHSVITAQQSEEGALHYIARDDEAGLKVIPFEGDPQKLLINQLMMTEAFGQASDESLKREKLKNEYKSLKKSDKKRKTEIKDTLGVSSIKHTSQSLLNEDQAKVLEEIKKLL